MTNIYRLPFMIFALALKLAALEQSGPTPEQLNQVDSLFSTELARQQYGGVTTGIVYNNQLIWTKGYGLADIENRVAADAGTVYPIGSITKQFTALMLLQLVSRGRVRLADPVELYVPEVRQIQNPFPSAAPMTLLQLATHTAGTQGMLMPAPPALDPGTSWEAVLTAWFPKLRLDFEPGTQYQYSNIGYAILGLALERAAGEPYEMYIRDEILLPLGMTHTGFTLNADMATHVAKGYVVTSAGALGPHLDPVKTAILPAYFWPAGGLFSTLGDMAKFVNFELGYGPDQVLPFKQLVTNFSQIHAGVGDLSSGYGIGFSTIRTANSVMTGHDGAVLSTGGYTASAQMKRPSGIGLIFLRNFAAPGDGAPFGTDFEIAVLNAVTPACPNPNIATITNAAYGSTINVGDTLIVWGSGFAPYGGNALQFSNGRGVTVQLGDQGGQYFWDRSDIQINAAPGPQLSAGDWRVTVTNACGSQSTAFPLAIK